MSITHLAYISRCSSSLTQADIDTILAQSRHNNSRARLTGHLQCHCGYFFQVLEGPASEVDTLLARLQSDSRHSEMSILFRETTTQRNFANWSMGFGPHIQTDASPQMLETLQRLHRRAEAGSATLTASQVLMLFFELMRRNENPAH